MKKLKKKMSLKKARRQILWALLAILIGQAIGMTFHYYFYGFYPEYLEVQAGIVLVYLPISIMLYLFANKIIN